MYETPRPTWEPGLRETDYLQVFQPRPFCHVNPPRVDYLLHAGTSDSHDSVAQCSGYCVILGKGELQLHAPARRPTPVTNLTRLLWVASHFSCHPYPVTLHYISLAWTHL